MKILLAVLAACAAGWFLLRLTKRASAEFQARMLEIHELRVRAWRKRLQASKADAATADSVAFEGAALARRAADALAELRANHHDGDAAFAAAFDGQLDDDLAELQTIPPDLRRPAAADEARRRLARASRDAEERIG